MSKTYEFPSGLKKIVQVSESILFLQYDTQENLCKAFCRFEEFYESPEWKDKVFTLGQYREWYCKRYGAWTYYQDWSGFNVPGHSFQPFIQGLFDPLTPEESEMVNLVRNKKGPYAVIGAYLGADEEVYEHEICHALFATNPKYKDEVTKALKPFDKALAPLKKALRDELGYNDAVILDECHAYICESSSWMDGEKIPYPEKLKPILKKIKAKHKV